MHTLQTIRDGILLAVLGLIAVAAHFALFDWPLDRALQ